MTTDTREIDHKRGALRDNNQMDYVLLDGSGSMQSKWYDSLAAIQTYVDGLNDEHINSRIILSVFSDGTSPESIERDVNILDWLNLREYPITSRFGGTPLYDAIVLMGARLRDMDPVRCSILIVTDGQEAGSRFGTLTQAKAILDWCRAKGWQVTFIGADFRNAEQARALGADENSAIGVQQRRLSDATRSLAKKRARYGATGEDMHFTGDEKQQFGGYLNAPTK